MMRPNSSKWIIATVLIVVIITLGIFGFFHWFNKPVELEPMHALKGPTHNVIGWSVEKRPIGSYTYGDGANHIAFVGGIHGGYEWNSVILAYRFMDYLSANPDIIPKNLTVTIIPSANPDGVFKVIGKEGRFTVVDVPVGTAQSQAAGRFNTHNVDLNRNFDCKWQATSTWQTKPVSAGSAAFSEPESQAIRNFVLKDKSKAVIFWHSQSNAVYASQCKNGILPGTLALMNTYALAAGYPAVKEFGAYVTTGAADDWLASINIPAITVELKTHETIEWEKNLAGVKALFNYYK